MRTMHATANQQRRAWSWVARMVKRGALDRRPCAVCGDARAEAHHADYAQPFAVSWLCRYHHASAHWRPQEPGQLVWWLGA